MDPRQRTGHLLFGGAALGATGYFTGLAVAPHYLRLCVLAMVALMLPTTFVLRSRHTRATAPEPATIACEDDQPSVAVRRSLVAQMRSWKPRPRPKRGCSWSG